MYQASAVGKTRLCYRPPPSELGILTGMCVSIRALRGTVLGLTCVLGVSVSPFASAQSAASPTTASSQATSAGSAAATDSATAGGETSSSTDADKKEPSAWELALAGRTLLKEKDGPGAVAKIKAALAQAEKESLAADDQALMQYLLSLAAIRAGDDELALLAITAAVRLAPKEADYQLELANQLLSAEKNREAKQHAEEALRLGLSSEDDRKDAQKVVQQAKSAMIHERLSLDFSVSAGFDSNVIQGGQAETIGGVPTGARQNTETTQTYQTQLRERNRELIGGLVRDYRSTILSNYNEPIPSKAEFDVPVTLSMDLGGRLLGTAQTELWAGYRFTQIVMTSPVYNHEAYSLQEHVVPLRFQWQAKRWLLLRPRLEGFANFTGLSSFAPFQGGLTAVLDMLFIESSRFRTRVIGTYQLRRSFDRAYDYLDGDRIDGKVSQELRINPGGKVSARGQLSYRFRADLSGFLDQSVDLQVLSPNGATVTVGNYDYRTPLSYFGHEIGTRWRLLLPAGVDLALGGSADFRGYREDTTATYTARPLTVPCVAAIGCSGGGTVTIPKDGTSTIALPSVRRRDVLVALDFGVAKSLPAGFSLDLTYTFLRNGSNIANGIDNRNYTKHSILLTTYYSF